MDRRLRGLICIGLVIVFLGTLVLGGCSAADDKAAAPEASEEAAAEEEQAAASLSGSLLAASADKLSAGENSQVPASGSAAMGSKLPSRQTSILDQVADSWLFPDGNGGVIIDDEPSITIFDANGGEAGPYAAEEGDGYLYVLLGQDEIAEILGQDTGLENVSFAFIPTTESEDELLMALTDEDSGNQQWFLLTRASFEQPGEDGLSEEEQQVVDNVNLLVEACLYYAYTTGEMPSVNDVEPDGAIAELLTGWPTNPYTGEPMEYVTREQKAGNYEVSSAPASVLGMFARSITGYFEDGTAYEVTVPYEQVGL